MNQITPIREFQTNLERISDQLESVLPPHIRVEKFNSVVMIVVQRTPELLQLNRQSLYNACIQCATDGLIPDGREAALVKFGDKCQYMPMTQGILKKIRNSGELGVIDAQVVYEGDEYDSWVDENGQHFRHKKTYKNRGNPLLTFAYAKTKDGFVYFEEINEDEMANVEKMSKSKTVWQGAFRDEMKRKTVIRRLAKRLPMNTDIEQVITKDDELYDLDKQEETADVPEVQTEQPKKSRLEEVVTSQVEEAVLSPEPEPEAVDIGIDNIVEGEVQDMKTKSGENNGKKWTKFGIKVNDEWYSTFSNSIHETVVECMDNKIPVRIEYETSEYQGKNYRNIVTLEKATANEEVPI